MRKITKGLYRHFKGFNYEVIEPEAVHTETGEIFVIYRSLKDNVIYARPLEMFRSEVDKDKYPAIKEKYRFTKIESGE